MLDLLTRYPNELTLIALGPLTNVAEALLIDRKRVSLLREVVIMGGAITVPGNITPAAEFNLFMDPTAAKHVFESGLAITLVPLDVTAKIFLKPEDIFGLSQGMRESFGGFLLDSTSMALKYMKRVRGTALIHLHDPLAVGVAIDPSLVKISPLNVAVETHPGIARGATIADLRPIRDDLKQPPNLHVALEVDIEAFLKLFKERLCQGSW
jgi:purine nucleosidase/pyrimidine-specific ribonucleoside hydrolase